MRHNFHDKDELESAGNIVLPGDPGKDPHCICTHPLSRIGREQVWDCPECGREAWLANLLEPVEGQTVALVIPADPPEVEA